jgi:hypothetical protein
LVWGLVFLLVFLFFFWQHWSLNSGSDAC